MSPKRVCGTATAKKKQERPQSTAATTSNGDGDGLSPLKRRSVSSRHEYYNADVIRMMSLHYAACGVLY